MADIIYTYEDQVYGNITNKCDCSCTFCVRSHQDTIGQAASMWHKKDPSLEEIKAAMDAFDFSGYSEFVFCGYGEPTCAMENLLASGAYLKEKYPKIRIRVNTNGLGNLYNKRDIVPELAKVVDSVSISLNAPNAEEYQEVSRPIYEHAYEALLDFAEECSHQIAYTQLTIVDVLPIEDQEQCKKIAAERGVHLRIRKYI